MAQIQAAVGLSRPTVYRLLETLEGLGLIQSEGNPQLKAESPVRLGQKLATLKRWATPALLPTGNKKPPSRRFFVSQHPQRALRK